MAIQGMRDTSNFVADSRPKNWREGILLLSPNGSSPLFALTTMLKSRSVDDAEFNWWEKSIQTRRVQLASGATALDGSGGTDTITLLAGGNGMKLGDILKSEESGELLRVVVINSDTSIDVVRTFGAVAATIVDTTDSAVNPFLIQIGTVLEEGSDAPTGVQFDPVKKFNYTQIFRDTLEFTRTASKTRLRTGDQVREAKRECLEIHSMGIERALFFGERIETTINGKPARMMGGIVNYIHADNIVAAGATTNMLQLEGWMERAFRFGSSEKMCFTGNQGLLIINQIVRKNSTYQIVTGLKEFGMNVTRLISPFGELVIKTHPLFNQMMGDAAGNYLGESNNLTILDMNELVFTKFNGGETKWQPKLQENGLDGFKSGYLSELSLETHHPTTHFRVTGLKAAAADA